MANPITWRNVVGPSLADASRPMESATQSLNGAFDQLRNMLKEREAIDAGNVLVQQENQKNAFLDMLQRATTPEQLAALQQSQEFQAAQAALSPAARAATRGAFEQRLEATRDLVTKGQAYDINQREFNEQPEVAAINALIEAGKFDEARARLDTVQLRDETPLEQALRLRQRGEVKEGYEDNAENRAQAAHADARKNSALSRQLTGLQIEGARLGLEEKRLTAADNKAVRELQNRVGQELTAHHERMRDLRSNATAILGSLTGIQFNSDGSPALETLTPEQQTQVDQILKSNGIQDGLRVFTHGDTAAADRIMRTTLKGVPQHIAQRVLPQILSGVDTSGLGLVGIDAKTANTQYGETAAAMEELRGGTWYAPGSKNALNAYEEILKDLPNLIDKTSGFNPEEDIPHLAKKLREVAVKGVKLSDGSYMVPSIQDIKAALASAEGGQWIHMLRDARRSENFEAILRKNLSQPEIDKMRRDAQLLEHWDRRIAAERAAAERGKAR